MPIPILFAHGLESGPIGTKSIALRDAGFTVDAPDCRKQDLSARIEILARAIVASPEPPLLVGSSFGGIAGLCAAIVAAARGRTVAGIVLCAPALQVPPPFGVVDSLAPPAPTEIVHGRGDEVIPIALSRDYATRFGVPLHECDDDHRLAAAGMPIILDVVRRMAGDP
jgi:predicted alpha/beta hydrolase family esterase